MIRLETFAFALFKSFIVWVATVSITSAETLKLYGNKNHVIVASEEMLSAEAKRAFSSYRKSDYFGAFAYNSLEEEWGYYREAHHLNDAKSWALKNCKHRSQKPSNCAIYAVTVPRGYQENSKEMTLSKDATKSFRRGYSSEQIKGKFGAFAVNPVGSSAFSWGYAQRDEAIERARLQCESSAHRYKAKVPTYFRRSIATAKDWKCVVIHVSEP